MNSKLPNLRKRYVKDVFKIKNIYVRVFAALLVVSLLSNSPANAGPLKEFPSKSTLNSKLFILDISNSNNYQFIWKQSLRTSIIRTLEQPFGYPAKVLPSYPNGLSPSEIYVTSISSNSLEQEIFPIITSTDVSEIWAAIAKTWGDNPNYGRTEILINAVFGGQGAYTVQAQNFSADPLQPPKEGECVSQSLKIFMDTPKINKITNSKLKMLAESVCKVTSKVTNNLIKVDTNFSNAKCSGNCSDILGAVLKANYKASDLVKNLDKNKISYKPSLCIAIASDLLNNSKNPDPLLNVLQIVNSAKSETEAKTKGIQAAKKIGIKFPKNISIKIETLGIGSGKTPLPLSKNSILTSYWSGVWEEAGVTSTEISLDRACSEKI